MAARSVIAATSNREKALVEAAASMIYVFDLKPEHPLSVALAAYENAVAPITMTCTSKELK